MSHNILSRSKKFAVLRSGDLLRHDRRDALCDGPDATYLCPHRNRLNAEPP